MQAAERAWSTALLPRRVMRSITIEVNGIQRRLTPKNIARNLVALWHLALSGPRAGAILREVQPDLVIGAGGYVSGPVVQAAARRGHPHGHPRAERLPRRDQQDPGKAGGRGVRWPCPTPCSVWARRTRRSLRATRCGRRCSGRTVPPHAARWARRRGTPSSSPSAAAWARRCWANAWPISAKWEMRAA